ncbi:MAG: hypothetical protein ACI8ZF_000577 [Candidatus Midichloriaceae bacterium]
MSNIENSTSPSFFSAEKALDSIREMELHQQSAEQKRLSNKCTSLMEGVYQKLITISYDIKILGDNCLEQFIEFSNGYKSFYDEWREIKEKREIYHHYADLKILKYKSVDAHKDLFKVCKDSLNSYKSNISDEMSEFNDLSIMQQRIDLIFLEKNNTYFERKFLNVDTIIVVYMSEKSIEITSQTVKTNYADNIQKEYALLLGNITMLKDLGNQCLERYSEIREQCLRNYAELDKTKEEDITLYHNNADFLISECSTLTEDLYTSCKDHFKELMGKIYLSFNEFNKELSIEETNDISEYEKDLTNDEKETTYTDDL